VSEHNLINLLVINQSSTTSEPIIQTLRTAGYLVQQSCAANEKEIRNVIDYKPLDLIILRPSQNLPPLSAIREWVKASYQDVPIIVVVDNFAQQNPLELLRAGADNFFEPSDPEYLQIIVRKELHHAQLRKEASSQKIRLEESEARLRMLLDSSRDAIAYIHEGAHVYANPAYVKQFGYANEEEMAYVALMTLVVPDDRDELKRFLLRSFKAGKRIGPIELTGLDKHQNKFPIRMECLPTRMHDEPCLQISIQNPAQQQQLEQQLKEFSKRDPFTEPYNRKFFTDHLNKIHTGATKPGGAVFYILITNYRSVSDQLGLEAADQLSVEVAELLKQEVTEQEIVARFADAVFTVYTPDGSPETALHLAKRLSKAIKNHASHASHALIGPSSAIGICLVRDRRDNATQILSNANRACEIARQQGDHQLQIYAPPDTELGMAKQEEELVERIREAISAERLHLLFQPIASFQGDATERYKVYLRILDENHNPLSLDSVAPVAESHGLMHLLDKWVVAQSLGVLVKHYQHSGKFATLFIHISSNSLLKQDFHPWLENKLKDAGLPGTVLVLEIAETCVEQYFKETQDMRERLRQLDCGFAVSHFGGKANSERILVNLMPDYIKLESALIEKLAKDKKDEISRLVVANITEKAKEINIPIVATNIATAPQMASIWQFGVTLAQGDMVQEPGPQMDFDFQQFVG
jgi:diguanylate cyclase (GGDEF)-like protein/PAS domain S-box-containing protein